VEEKIDIIERNLKFLEEYKGVGEAEFTASYKDVQAVKFSLLEIIEACIDIESYIIASGGLDRAESYAEMFEILGREGLISRDLLKG